jgi:MFS-type transporter involved in bile tolerance (Atg22 family)
MASQGRWDWRRVLLFIIPVSAVAAVMGAVFGWLADRWVGAVVGALVMALIFAPLAGLFVFFFSPAGPLDD